MRNYQVGLGWPSLEATFAKWVWGISGYQKKKKKKRMKKEAWIEIVEFYTIQIDHISVPHLLVPHIVAITHWTMLKRPHDRPMFECHINCHIRWFKYGKKMWPL